MSRRSNAGTTGQNDSTGWPARVDWLPAVWRRLHAVLSKGRRSHSLRGSRVRFSAAGHAGRRIEFPRQQLANRRLQRDGSVQERFRCITMDQRNANGGEFSGPVPVARAWDAFADDQLGLMDHLGILNSFRDGLLYRRLLRRQADATRAATCRGRRVLPDRGPSARRPGCDGPAQPAELARGFPARRPDETFALVERHFGDIPRRRVPARPDFAEPAPHLGAPSRNTSTSEAPARPWHSPGGSPTQPTSRRTCRCWRAGRRARLGRRLASHPTAGARRPHRDRGREPRLVHGEPARRA